MNRLRSYPTRPTQPRSSPGGAPRAGSATPRPSARPTATRACPTISLSIR